MSVPNNLSDETCRPLLELSLATYSYLTAHMAIVLQDAAQVMGLEPPVFEDAEGNVTPLPSRAEVHSMLETARRAAARCRKV